MITKDSPQDILDLPMPLQNAANYDHKRIINALLYADSTLRSPNQKVSPIGMRAPLVDKDACARFLDMEEGEIYNEKDENLEAARAELDGSNPHVWALDAIYSMLKSQPITRRSNLSRRAPEPIYSKPRFILVRETFLQWHCRQLRSEAEAKKTEDWQSLDDNYWPEINKKIFKRKRKEKKKKRKASQ